MPEHDNNAPSQAAMTTLDKQEANERLVGDYVLLSKIGQGSFATVYKAQHKASLRHSWQPLKDLFGCVCFKQLVNGQRRTRRILILQ